MPVKRTAGNGEVLVGTGGCDDFIKKTSQAHFVRWTSYLNSEVVTNTVSHSDRLFPILALATCII